MHGAFWRAVMIRFAVVSAVLLAAGFAGQARAQAVVEDPGYCAQYYPNSNCTNYGPGNPLYPGRHVPSGPAGNYYYGGHAGNYYDGGYYGGPYGAAPSAGVVRHRHRHHVYR